MHNGLVYFPDCELDGLEYIRKEYDPTSEVVHPHVTVVFPVPDVVTESSLVDHIDDVLSNHGAFEIQFGGFRKSRDHWLFLELAKGASEFIELHSTLYTGILAEYLRPDVEYVPHLGLGLFLKNGAIYNWDAPNEADFDKARYDRAMLEAEALDFDLRCCVNRLELVSIPDEVIDWVTGKLTQIRKGVRISRRRSFVLD
jgi:2'-5' RNA ligase